MLIEIFLGSTSYSITEHSHFDQIIKHNKGTFAIFAFFILFAFIIGLVGFQANYIQLGLDQLFEAPSQYLGLFIHYATWAFQSGALSFIPIFYLLVCSRIIELNKSLVLTFAILFVLSMATLLLISCAKRKWFHIEPGYHNPYLIVYGILKFAKSHKHPLQRSAFTFCENYIPSRLDFAKERFGGPFTTEQVENVKTFLRILLILFALGPAFVLEVPASNLIFPLFGLHLLHQYTYTEYCSTSKFVWEVMLDSGIATTVISTVILFPIYMWIIFCQCQRKVPKIFVRLHIGILLCLLGVVSLLITDVVGHVLNRKSFVNIIFPTTV